jgi:hypothetical protein
MVFIDSPPSIDSTQQDPKLDFANSNPLFDLDHGEDTHPISVNFGCEFTRCGM